MNARLILMALFAFASPAAAQDHDHAAMDQGATQHSPQPADAEDAQADAHAGTDQATPHPDHRTADPSGGIGDAPPPPVPADHAADALFPVSDMAAGRRALMAESRFRSSAFVLEALELRAHGGRNGYRLRGRAWTGGDINRAVLAFDGEGTFGDAPESAEIGAYWRHAIDPWFNLQLGLRHDVRPDPERTYALIGIEGLAPYWIEAEAQLLVSETGDVHLSASASHDVRVTQRFVVAPEAELDLAMQDVPEPAGGSGVDRLELGVRARYELERNLAPYVGISWERKLGDSARLARLDGKRASLVSFLAGLRFWF